MEYKSASQVKALLGMRNDEDIAKVSITPLMAEEILETCNIKNRNLNYKAASFLRNQFNSGNYFLSSTCIGFDENGTLTDGQHRLMAISMCDEGKSFLMGVMFGVNQNMDMDTGRKRSLIDNALINDEFDERLKRVGASACVQVISTMLWFLSVKNFSQKQKRDICNYFATPLYECYKMGIFTKKKTKLSNSVRLAFFAAHVNGVPNQVLKQAYSDLASESGEFYNKIASKGNSGRDDRYAVYKYTQSYINKLSKKLKSGISSNKVYYKIDITNAPYMENCGGGEFFVNRSFKVGA